MVKIERDERFSDDFTIVQDVEPLLALVRERVLFRLSVAGDYLRLGHPNERRLIGFIDFRRLALWFVRRRGRRGRSEADAHRAKKKCADYVEVEFFHIHRFLATWR